MKERIRIRAPYITIAGSTAPGDGVCIAGDTVEIDTHDVIIRHMRFRRGETWVGNRNDSFGGNPVGNIMIDHVSASWGLDENMSMYRHMYQPPDGSKEQKLPTVNITIQNSIFSECLNPYNHSFGSTIGGYNATFHHNLWANNSGRNPSVGMIYDFTFANNVVFNWRHRTTDGGDHRSFYNIINNYYKPGPVTPRNKSISHRFLKPESRRAKPPVDDYGRAYVDGNIAEGNARVSSNNWDGGVQVDSIGDAATILKQIRADQPFPHAYLDIQSASDAYETVLKQAGATLPKRDAVDETSHGNGSHRKDDGGCRAERARQALQPKLLEGKGRRDGPPSLAGDHHGHRASRRLSRNIEVEPYRDSDNDGMPDEWETRHGLNPKDASDAATDLNGDGYTNIEDFINGLDPSAPKKEWPTPRTYEDLWSSDSELKASLDRK